MKLPIGMVSYLAGISALAAFSVVSVSYAIAPGSSAALKAEQVAVKSAETAAPQQSEAAATNADRQPTWIAPTTKYPASALALNNVPHVRKPVRQVRHVATRSNEFAARPSERRNSYVPGPRDYSGRDYAANVPVQQGFFFFR